MKTLLDKRYGGEDLADAQSDVDWAIDGAADIPKDKHGFAKGRFHVVVTWEPSEPSVSATEGSK